MRHQTFRLADQNSWLTRKHIYYQPQDVGCQSWGLVKSHRAREYEERLQWLNFAQKRKTQRPKFGLANAAHRSRRIISSIPHSRVAPRDHSSFTRAAIWLPHQSLTDLLVTLRGSLEPIDPRLYLPLPMLSNSCVRPKFVQCSHRRIQQFGSRLSVP